MNRLLLFSGKKLAELIRKREVTSKEVVRVHIEHIKRINPSLNALVRDRFKAAIKEAKRVDEHLKGNPDEVPPYYGVPCTIKESFAFKGMPNSGGLYSRRDYIAKEDATTVERLKKAGAIPLGVTNVPELCMWMETYNKIYGRTNNAYDKRRIPGGSSGGEGAIIGAGGSPFGLGSDLGGSIRLPAFFNGIFGHKPTHGVVPNTGQFPSTDGLALKFLTPGPLARRAEDLMPLLKILAGPDGKDPYCEEVELKNPEDVEIEKIRVFSIEDNGLIPVRSSLKSIQKRCAEFLKKKGLIVKEIKIDELKYSFLIWSSMLNSYQKTPFKVLMGDGKAIRPFFELIKWIFGFSNHTFPGIMLSISEGFRFRPIMKRFVEMGERLREKIRDLLKDDGVILYPSYSRPAPFHNRPLLTPIDFSYTAIFNVLRLPVTQVPLGLSEEGVPLGIQIVSNLYNDHITIRLAIELEKEFGGWQPPEWVRKIYGS